MIARSCARPLIGATLAALVLLLQDAQAAPNLYSETPSSSKTAARLTVRSPKAGLYTPGATIRIRWRKKTAGKEVKLWLYSATASGLRKKKMQTITPPTSALAKFTTKKGSFNWRIPSGLKPGRYMIVVKSKLDVAWSEAFGVRAAIPASADTSAGPKLSASTLMTAGTVKKVDVKSRGTKGSVVISRSTGDVTYEWGVGKCPELKGGLPGALATMAAIGKVEIQPRVRTVTENGKTLQRCMDGLVIIAGMPTQ